MTDASDDFTQRPTTPLPGLDSAAGTADAVPGPRRPAPDVVLPPRLGAYVVEQEIGRGGMGVVARARDERTGRAVALKFLHAELGEDEDELRRVAREARLLAAVRHPNVVEVLDVTEHAGAPVLVLELVEGETLRERLARCARRTGASRGALAPKDACRVGAQVASALVAAHARGVVHRDLKPANVRLTAEGEVKVLDFGLACRPAGEVLRSLASEARDASEHDTAGTLGYMAPEQVLSEAPTFASDVWALGCLLYEMLAGRPAVVGDTPAARARATLDAAIDMTLLPEEVESTVREVIAACLARDPSARPEAPSMLRVLEGGPFERHRAPRRRVFSRASSRFIGREAELERLTHLLASHSFVTITGAGGSGKTRLALEAASRLADDEREEPARDVVFVELAVLGDPRLVVAQVALAAGLSDRKGSDALDVLREAWRDASLLLVLDNCEHVLDAAAELVHALTAACPRVKMLATSREPLGEAGEAVLALPPLSVPPVGAESDADQLRADASVALLIDRAREARPSFGVDAGNAAVVAALCRTLDGIPLAIELAAARLRTLPVGRVLAEVEASIGALASTTHGALPRHQALRATVDWSVDRLTPDERTLHARLSVLAGPFTLAMAEAVGAAETPARGEVLPLLLRLGHKSLVQAEVGGRAPRWRLLEPIRRHAAERLAATGETNATRRRFVAAVEEMAGAAKDRLEGADVTACAGELADDHAHFVEALRLAATLDIAAGLRVLAATGGYWIARGLWREARALAEPLLRDARAAPPALRAPALLLAGQLALMLGEYAESEARLGVALGALRAQGAETDRVLLAECLNSLSQLAWERLQLDRARELGKESLAIRRSLDRPDLLVNSLNHLGVIARSAGDLAAARTYLDEALERQQLLGNPYVLTVILSNLSVVAFDQDDMPGARAALDQALVHARGSGARRGELFALANLANVDVVEGRWPDAAARHRAAIALSRELGDRAGALTIVLGSAWLALGTGRAQDAAVLLGAAVALRDASGAARFHRQDRYEAAMAQARGALGDEHFATLHDCGRALDLPSALDACERLVEGTSTTEPLRTLKPCAKLTRARDP